MYAQVVVLTYQPPNTDSYTYEIPKNLEKEMKIGQLINVPFGKRNPQGIIIATSNQLPVTSDKVKIKPISSIIFPQPPTSSLPNRTFEMDEFLLHCSYG